MTDALARYRDEWEAVVSRLVARAWLDPAFKAALLADPHPILWDEGLLFPDRYDVEFYEDDTASPGDWHTVGRGARAVHRFPIPPPPDALDTAADPLTGIDASGLACCCPCASCTGAVGPGTWT